MRVSIITATFNSGSTIGDTLQSILSQSYSDYEVIIKDGGSKDDTQRVVKESRDSSFPWRHCRHSQF